MFKNYFRLSLKSIFKLGHQSVISITGLSVALACGILILLYIQYEFSYDKYHEKRDDIYRVIIRQPDNSYMGNNTFAVTPGPLKEALINEVPEVENATKCALRSHTLEYEKALFTESGFLYADPDFLKIFTFPAISGDPAVDLTEPFTLFITEEMASKYFGNEDPIGKTIIADNEYLFTVAGIIENIPSNSHFDFDFLTGFETYYIISGGKENAEDWGSNSYITYIQLIDNIKPETVKSKINSLYLKYTRDNHHQKMELEIEPLKVIHMNGKINFEPGNSNDIRYIYLITFIGILIILIACFNYINMATARSYTRGKEIGLLKVAGSSKADLIIQFLSESLIHSAAGLILALIIVWFTLPLFSDFTDRPLDYKMILEWRMLSGIIILMLATGLTAGIYPAFHLASLSPLSLIKGGNKKTSRRRRSGYLRNSLIVLQFMISITALISTFTVLRQLNFIKKSDLGFDMKDILAIRLADPVLQEHPEVLVNELSSYSNITDIATSGTLPITISSNSRGQWEGKPDDYDLGVYRGGIGNNFIDFYSLEIIAGRGFSSEFPADPSYKYIINETAAKFIGQKDPVGMKFGFNGKMGTIIGVVKDFYFHSLRLPVEPLALSAVGNEDFKNTYYISVKVRPGTLSETRSFTDMKLKELSPHYINPVSILGDRVDNMYRSDRQLSTILIFSTVLALILTSLGQYSLSSYTTKSRMKEMVIRKVMGARTSEIGLILTRELTKWIIVSVLFAWPLAYLLMNKWLQGFAYHIEPGIGVFVWSLSISLVISLIAISYHVIKISRVNPAELIRDE